MASCRLQRVVMCISVSLVIMLLTCAHAYPVAQAGQDSQLDPETQLYSNFQGYCSQQNCTLEEREVACVSASLIYPDWEGTRLEVSDCLFAWNQLKLRIASQTSLDRLWTCWYQPPQPGTPLNHRTPIGEIKGTYSALCVL